MKKAKVVLIVFLSAVAIYSGGNIIYYLYDGYINKKINVDLAEKFHQFDEEISPSQIESNHEMPVDNSLRFKDLLRVNEDVVGWIQIPGTKIDYPVVQTDNNDFYLNHSIEKRKSTRGAIFMDYRNNDSLDWNTVIYGHNMKDKSMFGELQKYKDRLFFQEHSALQFDSMSQLGQWTIFAVFVQKADELQLQIQFSDEQEFGKYLDELKRKSLYNTGVEVTSTDRILTLITCSNEADDNRLALFAKLVTDNE